MKLCRSLTIFSAGLLVSARAADFTVTSKEDSGPGSLRQAITDAAAAAGDDTIQFNIAAAPPEITLLTPLPALNGDKLDGLTQPGETKVKLRWNFQGSLIPVEGQGAVIQGLQFQSDYPAGMFGIESVNALRLVGAGSHLVKACWFTGFQTSIIAASPNNIIGGGTGERNRFTGYTAFQTAGTAATPATGSVIRGNDFLPPTEPMSMAYYETIDIREFSDNTVVESDASSGAVNTFNGLANILQATNSPNLVFRGNRSGDTAPNGSAFSSANHGLITLSNCTGALVENNSLLQSGNYVLAVGQCLNAKVRDNTILNVNNFQIFNLNPGVTVTGSGPQNLQISGNIIGGTEVGIYIQGRSATPLTGVRVDGNFIGLSQAYTPSSESPVVAPASVFFPVEGAGLVVEGNVTGLEIGGAADAGIGHRGPNTIVASPCGVVVTAPYNAPFYYPRGIRTDRNRIALMYAERLPGAPPNWSIASQWGILANTQPYFVILSNYVIPANDPNDADTGSNGLMNYPTLAVSATHATGTLDTAPNTACAIQVNACTTDGAALTGVPVFIGTASITTDAQGHATYSIPLPGTPPAGSIYYAMATDNLGNTSHIGGKVMTPLATVGLALPTPEVRAVEGTPFEVTLTRSGDLSIASTVRVLVSAGDAVAPAFNGDATDAANSASVTFAPGEASKGALIPITDDNLTEPAENIRLTVETISGAVPGAVISGLITITYSDLPRVSIGDATVVEGNNGTRVVTLPVSLDRPVSGGFPVISPDLRFRFVGGTATRIVDYNRADFQQDDFLHAQLMPGGTQDVIHMVVFGDTSYEPGETVIVEYDHTRETYSDGSPVIDETHHPRGTLTIQNDDQAVVRIVPLDVMVSEGDSGTTSANLSIQLAEGPIDVEVRVPWQTVNGTAIAGSDFAAASGEVVLPPGTASETISIQVTGDTLVDNWPAADESFTVQLGTPVNAIVAPGQGSAAISIHDDDSRSITLNDASLTEGNSGTAVMTFTATIPSATGSPVSFQWNTAVETADPSDFTGLSGTLTIPAGLTETSINIDVKGDTLYELNETFSIVTGAATNGIPTRDRATGTILNDDTAPSMTVTNTVVTEGAEDVDFYAWFQVRLTAASGAPVTFQWSTAAGTATAGLDYVESSNTSVIAPGDRDLWVAVPVLGDDQSDSNETFQLRIPGASGATVPPAGLTGTCTLKETTITSFRPFSGVPGLYAMAFWTGLGQSYLIEKSISLGDDQEWSTVSGIIPGSNAEITQLQFSETPSSYFRVRVTATPPN